MPRRHNTCAEDWRPRWDTNPPLAPSDITRYPIEVFWSDEDGGYMAIAPDLPGASAWGKSEAEAVNELRAAIELCIKAAKTVGNPVPESSDRADVNS